MVLLKGWHIKHTCDYHYLQGMTMTMMFLSHIASSELVAQAQRWTLFSIW